MTLGQHRPGGSATDRLDPKRPRAGEQVEGQFPLHVDAKQVEQALPNTLLHRPGAGRGGEFQRSAAEIAADDPRRTGRFILTAPEGAAVGGTAGTVHGRGFRGNGKTCYRTVNHSTNPVGFFSKETIRWRWDACGRQLPSG